MKPRTKKTLFITFAALFFLAIPVIVLFTQGYRVDFENRRLVETGGLDLNITAPLDVDIYLNGELEKHTSFIFRNVVFRNILPDTYEARLEKSGHQPWQKTAVVEGGRVTQFIDIRLFPNELGETVLAERATDIAISPDTLFALATSQGPETTFGSRTKQLLLVNTDTRATTALLTLQSTQTVSVMEWAPDSSAFYVVVRDASGETSGYTGAVPGESGLLNWSGFLGQSYPGAYNTNNIVRPGNTTSVLYVLKKLPNGTHSLDRVNLAERTIRPNIATGIIGWQIVDNTIFYVDEDGAVKKTNIENSSTEEISPTALAKPDISNTKLIVREDGNAVVILSGNGAFLWESGEPLEKIEDNVNGVSFAPDNEKILLWKDNEAVIYWTKETFGPPQRTIASKERIRMNNLQSAHWATQEAGHVILRTENKLTIAELDGRDRRNTAQYGISISNPVVINKEKNTIYTKHGENLVELSYKPR